MHGAGDGNIIFGDGLENYKEKNIIENTFNILVANPPYSVLAFKPHLRLKYNEFTTLPKISNNGSEIETLFVERITQLVKPQGVAAVILPNTILSKESESFVVARELILQNFYIRAIVQFGSKTFGATGTNTVILFLEKYNETPKRITMVRDSVEAIFENRSLKEWEDEVIFKGYLEKIGVEANTYKKFVNREKDYVQWEEDPYFSHYVMVFKNSSECTVKERQKSFLKASEKERMIWYNQHFYDFVKNIEVDKLTYFALCYHQNTLIVASPEENKEQEKFLGYKWSNRKGQEGIQIISMGGLLFNATDRTDVNKIAGIIRNAFSQKQCEIQGLQDYYYYLRLQDMLEFSGVNFNKAIKTTRVRNSVIKPGVTEYKLNSNNFSISIGNRVLSTEIVENGRYPVYSANVFEEFGRINKQNITDFSKPSIIWGIDGDWMVNYIPANQPFYPTDHCGVMRIDTDEILPQYMALALQREGEYEKFSRSNRASIQHIKNLIIRVPEKKIQQSIVDEVTIIDEKIDEEEKKIAKFSDSVKLKFTKMFGRLNDSLFEKVPLSEVCSIITDGTHQTPEYIDSERGIKFLSSKNVTKEYIDWDNIVYIPKELHEKLYKRLAPKRNDILLAKNGTIGIAALNDTDEVFDVYVSLAVLRHNNRIMPEYLLYAINNNDTRKQFKDGITGLGVPNLHLNVIRKTQILLPNIDLQNKFVQYVRKIYKLKNDAITRKKEYIEERKNIIEKYFNW